MEFFTSLPQNQGFPVNISLHLAKLMFRPRQVALIIDAAKPYDRKIIQGVATYVQEKGGWSLYVEEDPLHKLPDFRTWGGDGVIANFDARKVAEAVARLRLPAVGVGGGYGWYDPSTRIPYFNSDNEGVARLAAEHLINRGFRRLAYYGFMPTRINRWSEIRQRAFQRAARKAGIRCAVHVGPHGRARKWTTLQRELAGWLKTLEKPVGLMACNDAGARHVLEACRTAGLRVPDDVAVVGVDNDEMICELTTPPLTSVEQGARRMGYQAAELLDTLMSGKKARRLKYLVEPVGVVTRRSTDALAVRDEDVARAMRFIREHACEGIQVPDVVEAVAVSRSTLENRFRALVGRTVRAEIRRVQLERARRLVSATHVPLKQIATQTGFRSVQYMTVLFRRQLGEPPAEYRRRTRG